MRASGVTAGRRAIACALLGWLMLACQTSRPARNATSKMSDAACARAGEPRGEAGLRWFEDDLDSALQCAAATRRPMMIDLWAPWCHTCLAMKHSVLQNAGLASLRSRVVWVALDTDKPRNAAALQRYQPEVWPTFLMVASDGSMQGRLLGSASVGQFRRFVLDGEKAHLDTVLAQHKLAANDPRVALRQGDRAAMGKSWSEAAKSYRRALSQGGATWPRRDDVLVQLIGVLYRAEDWPACTLLAEQQLDTTGPSASAGDFAYYAFECASRLHTPERARALNARLLNRLRALSDNASAPLSADDRSEVLHLVRDLCLALGQEEPARQAARRQRDLLARATREAPDALAASTYNWPRAEVHVFLGEGEALLPDLRTSTAALPQSYDPPYRLAWLLHKMGRDDEALDSARRALALCYGPRKARVQWLLADILQGAGQIAQAITARRRVIELYRALPASQQREGFIEAAQAELDRNIDKSGAATAP